MLAQGKAFDSPRSLRTSPSTRHARSGHALRLAALAQGKPFDSLALAQGKRARFLLYEFPGISK
jgi:hypothetical protein